MKTLLAIALGLGFLLLEAKAASTRPILAFLGFTEDSDPLFRQNLAQRIRFELSADSGLSVIPVEAIDKLYAKGINFQPEISTLDLPNLVQGLGAQYYAFARLEPLENSYKRTWWKPWSLKVKWTQSLRLRILDASTGNAIFDSLIFGELTEKGFVNGPDRWQDLNASERDSYVRRMLPVLALESSKALAKAIKEKAAPVEAAGSTPVK